MNTRPDLMVIDDLSPEDLAMLQALYSRSAESARTHLEKVKKAGSGKFMSQYYVGYGHKSIADCGSTTMFIENVSLLAAKAIQDWPLYSGQETSTRYIDMSERDIVNPVGGGEANIILNQWMLFYTANQTRVAGTIRERYPIREGENPTTYEKAVQARTFDVLRGFLPAGITTQLSWHSNLRQAGDHLNTLVNHQAEEIREIALALKEELASKYPSSGFKVNTAGISGVAVGDSTAQEERLAWERKVGQAFSYQPSTGWVGRDNDETVEFTVSGNIHETVKNHLEIFESRPRGCALPHFLSDAGLCHFSFLLDFGSFRDIQRHRNGVCRMPLLTTNFGFEPWYLEQLDDRLRVEAEKLIDLQAVRIKHLTSDSVAQQYYTALGFRVPTDVTYALPATVYVLELRSGKAIHPSLRKKILKMVSKFGRRFPEVKLHVDLDPSDWDVRRGTQTITEKKQL